MVKILVIDDEKIVGETMKRLLERNGYETFTAENGEEGLEIFRKENPEIVLADIKMPGINGIEVLKQIKEEEKDTEVIMITGHGGETTAIEALKRDAFGYLHKPVDYDELEVEIKKALEKQEMQKKLVEHVHNLEEAVEEKKRELNRRMQAEEKLQNLVKFANVGIIAAEEGKIVQANKKAEEIYGYSEGELIGQTAAVLFPVEYREFHKEILHELIEPEKFKMLSFEEEGLRKDGTLFPLEIAFSLSKGEDNYSVIAVMRDIIERKEAEETVRNTRDYLKKVIENSADSIAIGDSTGDIVKANKAFLELLGREEEEGVSGMHIFGLTVREEGTYESTTGKFIDFNEEYFKSAQEIEEILFEEGRISNCEHYYLRKDKKVVPVEMSIVFLSDQHEERIGCVGISRDITERKKMEMQLKETTAQMVQSEKLSALGELTAGVAHELKQPLNGIKIISQSLLKDIERGQVEREELGEDLHDMVTQVNKMADIIDHMRIFTRSSEGIIQESFDINGIIEGAFKFLGQQLRDHNIQVGEDFSPDLPKVVGDSNRLEQVLRNLISNASNAVESNGKEEKRIGIRTYRINSNGDSAVVIEVSDNGNGVPEHARKKVFQPFFTTNPPGKGIGLGLSVASKIVEDHQGRIELDSTLGEGTTFRVILPVNF